MLREGLQAFAGSHVVMRAQPLGGSHVVMLREALREALRGGSHPVAIADRNPRAQLPGGSRGSHGFEPLK